MPKNSSNKPLTIITDNPQDSLWEQLSVYESHELSRRFLEKRCIEASIQVNQNVIEKKAQALSYCIKNAREYMRLPHTSMTTMATSNYYGCLWLASALAVSDPHSTADLTSLEKATKHGHGLSNLHDDHMEFPNNEFIYITDQGFLKEFLQWSGLSKGKISEISWSDKRPKTFDDVCQEKEKLLIPLPDLFARIPEITDAFENITGSDAKNFEIFHAHNELEIPFMNHEPGVSVIGVYGDYTQKHLEDNNLPLTELSEYSNRGSIIANPRWAGKISHSSNEKFFDQVYAQRGPAGFYCSPLSGYFFVSPLLKHITNILVIHLMLSYQLSILARYRPAVWREILEGRYDQYRTLIGMYHRISSRVVPHLVLNAIAQRRIRIPVPGTW